MQWLKYIFYCDIILQTVKKDYKKYAYMFEQKDRSIRTKASKVCVCFQRMHI